MRFLRYVIVVCVLLLIAFLLFPEVASDGAIPLRVSAEVTDPVSGNPIEGARIVLMSARSNQNPSLYIPPDQAIASTDKSGTATVWDHFPAGWSTFRGGVVLEGATITATAEGYEDAIKPVSDKKRIRYWNFWRPNFTSRIELKKTKS
jgi:hypothetical protein